MAVSLKKGEKVSLAKEASSLGIEKLSKVSVGLGWDCSETKSMDLDAWAYLVDGEELKRKQLVYFNNTVHESRSVRHMGDNLTGEGEGDDETININLETVPSTTKRILLGVTIFNANDKKQSFNDVKNGFVRVYDTVSSKELCRYECNSFGDYTSLLFGILNRVNGVWEFNAIGKGSKCASAVGSIKSFREYTLDTLDGLVTSQNSEAAIENNNNHGGNKKMAVSLSKGGKVSLAKVAADAGISGGLTKVIVGLGWDTNKYDGGGSFDLDAAAFMLGSTGKVRNDKDFIFYNNKTGQGIEHLGDNRTGEGDGDDEQIKLDLSALPADVEKVAFTVTIDTANVNFGMVENSYIRIMDEVTGTELIRYDLGEDFSIETAIVVAELYKHNGEWKFNAIGSGFSGGLAALCGNFGIEVG